MRRWFLYFLRGRSFRGSNRRWWAGVSEALLAAALLLAGVVMLVVSLTLAALYWSPQDGLYISIGFFVLQLVLSTVLIAAGTYWIGRLLRHVGVSAERRGAIATRTNELELLKELRQRRADLPTIARDHFPPRAGRHQSVRLMPSPRNVWGLLSSAIFSVIFVTLATILILVVATAFGNETTDWYDVLAKQLNKNQLGRIPDRPWLAAALLVPISLAACWSIYQFFRQLLKLTGIGQTSLEVSNYPLVPGQTYDVFLSQAGRVRLKLLDVKLVCQEEATYNQGTDIRTEHLTVLDQRLFRRRGISVKPGLPYMAEFKLKIPDHAMHSFKSPNNRIQWKIVVTGQAKSWPKLKRNFAVSVHPTLPLATQPAPKQ